MKLQSIDQLNMRNYSNLKYLDLSFNNLTQVKSESFKNFFILEYLDFSHNQIEYLDETIMSTDTSKNLKYLNLAFNKLYSINRKWKSF